MLSSVLLPLLALAAHAAALVRGPYVEGVTQRSAFVCFRTDEKTLGVLELARPKGPPVLVRSPEASAQHCLEAAGLVPSGRYEYRVGYRTPSGPERWSPSFVLRAADGPGRSPIRFAVFGDSGRATREQLEVARQVQAAAPDFVLHVGDVVYPYGEDEDYDSKYFAQYGPLLTQAPIYIAIGNHDYGNEWSRADRARARLKDFMTVHRLPRLRSGEERTYYSFDWGHGHFAAVDSNQAHPIAGAPPIEPGSEQWRWLDRDLAETKRPWKFVFFHHAAYSSGGHGSDPHMIRSLAPLLERHGVDLVFQGHDHDYERTTPIVNGRPAGKGPVYLVVGTGGARLTPKQVSQPWSRVFRQEHGFLDVTLERDRLRARAVSHEGRVFDSFELKKRPPPAVSPR